MSSSKAWLARQKIDQYVIKANREGYRSRAAYKLMQLSDRVKPKLLRPGAVAIDLGAAPGSWSQVMVKHGMRVVGCDLLPFEPLEGSDFVQGDFRDEAVQQQLLALLDGQKADMVVSDISPDRSGLASLDGARICDYAEKSIEFSRQCLKPGGSFVCKLLQCADLEPLMQRLKPCFGKGAIARLPPATRQKSKEVYFLGRNWDPKAIRQQLGSGRLVLTFGARSSSQEDSVTLSQWVCVPICARESLAVSNKIVPGFLCIVPAVRTFKP